MGSEDETYQLGFLLDPSIIKLNVSEQRKNKKSAKQIVDMEIWGLGQEDAIKSRDEFKENNLKQYE